MLLNKQTVKSEKEYKTYDNLQKATLISAVNPLYFKPVVDGESVYISGDAMAVSPALLAFLTATEYGGKDAKDIEVFSVGSIEERADKIPDNIGLVEWVSRLSSLQGASKQHSQDYLMDHILQSYDRSFKKYFFPMSYSANQEFKKKS